MPLRIRTIAPRSTAFRRAPVFHPRPGVRPIGRPMAPMGSPFRRRAPCCCSCCCLLVIAIFVLILLWQNGTFG
jgi:hypothetical protein